MTPKRKWPFNPDWALCPGEILQETLESDIHMLSKTAAIMPFSTIAGIVEGTKEITEPLAKQLEAGTGIEASFWLNAQKIWDAHQIKTGLKRS
jgi:plasmid maintenance system antidote protein VapI